MTVETKYYCDECKREVHKAISIAVIVVEGFYEMPKTFENEEGTKILGKIPTWHKTVYNKLLCYDCVGEGVQEHWGGEGKRDFKLLESARAFLIKHGFVRPTWRAR